MAENAPLEIEELASAGRVDMPVKLGELLLKENMISPQVTCAESLGVAVLLELSGAVIPEIEVVQALPDNAHNLVWVRS